MDYQSGSRGCFNCGDASHQARDCPKKGVPTCYNCGGQGHAANAPKPPRRSLAIDAVRLDIFHASARNPPEPATSVAAVVLPEVPAAVVKNATSAVRSDT
ncbi:hypothetical protein BGW36DRAFT_100440 [Talaromyces proteolyticus]|uniref:CCHC-type domain-containing protein n=1 Tax=Talaromyces proteolyticus TaxID=1131652 RepID=A0AAD4L4Y0_9EURO|nr:uncharacterized protein BGW36DRAFT_100440 [Talaromyces proteolyticus]KAH8704278.1 hypothetical protein BGW36DRAFT_100440 [Talaromyces proteolyticus]